MRLCYSVIHALPLRDNFEWWNLWELAEIDILLINRSVSENGFNFHNSPNRSFTQPRCGYDKFVPGKLLRKLEFWHEIIIFNEHLLQLHRVAHLIGSTILPQPYQHYDRINGWMDGSKCRSFSFSADFTYTKPLIT